MPRLEAPTEQEWSREAAKKMVRLATAIANVLGMDADDDRLCVAFLQPKLNPDPNLLPHAGGQNVRNQHDCGPIAQ